jgi:RNA polymerase subunit RPABC4/transcription elongation factor Spt4
MIIKQPKQKTTKFRVCKRCDGYYNSTAKQSLICPNCRKPAGTSSWNDRKTFKLLEKDKSKPKSI